MKLLHDYCLDCYDARPPRDGFGEALVALGKSNRDIVVLTGDLAESTRVLQFATELPEQFIEVGVAEQNMAGIAAGLALSGKIPFITSYAVFSPGRNWDQIRVSICYSGANVKIIGAHAGISVGPDGATHQALEDVAITRVLPKMVVLVPTDASEAYKATIAAAKHNGPCYIRFGREKTPVVTGPRTPFEIGRAVTVCDGADVTVIANGQLVYQALLAAKKLEGKLSVRVVNLHTVKPIDRQAIQDAAEETGAIVTAEEHQIQGGMGSAVAEILAETHPVPMERVGALDTFGESGDPATLLEHYHMVAADIERAIEKVIKRKST